MKLFDVYPLFDITPVKGQAAYVFDEKGERYLDFYGGHAVISIGHSHPHFTNALKSQIDKMIFYSNSVQNPLQKQLVEKLGKLSGCEDYQLFLTNSGAESNENALKIASFHNNRTKVLSFKNCFHGRTSAAVNITDNPKVVAPINKGFESVMTDFNDIEAAVSVIEKGDCTAVIIEGIQGVGGIHVANEDFLIAIKEACHKTNTVLILDEVQSGFARTGHFFAYQKVKGFEPDIVSMAKGMGNGFPVGGVLIHHKFKPSYGLLGTTFGGNHLACTAALAVLEVIEEESILSNVQKVGAYLLSQLKEINEIKSIRGEGLMLGLDFGKPVADLRKKLVFEAKIFTGSAKDGNTIRLLPPLNIGKQEVDTLIDGLKKCI